MLISTTNERLLHLVIFQESPIPHHMFLEENHPVLVYSMLIPSLLGPNCTSVHLELDHIRIERNLIKSIQTQTQLILPILRDSPSAS